MVSSPAGRSEEAVAKAAQAVGGISGGGAHEAGKVDCPFVFVGALANDGTIVNFNTGLLEAAGLRSDHIRGKPIWDCGWWSGPEIIGDQIRDAVGKASSGEVCQVATTVRLADDRLKAVEFTIAPLRDADGRITHLVANGLDVSRRAAAERELHRTARIIEEVPFVIVSTTPEGRMLLLNHAGRKLFGYGEDDDLESASIDRHHPAWAIELLRTQGYPTARASGHWLGEAAVLGADGHEIATSHVIVVHRDAQGEVEYFSLVAVDISREKVAEAELRESELRLRSTFENVAVGVAHISPSGRWLRVNERLLDIVGYSRTELVQKTLHEITHPDDLEASLRLFAQLDAGDIDSYALEKRCIRKDGRVVWVEFTVSAQKGGGGAEPYFIAIVEEIGARREAEERQRLLLAELNHRVKNTLAMVQSIASQTLRQSRDPKSFVASFMGRLQSLSGAHDLLTEQTWEGADLAELLRSQVGLNGIIEDNRIRLSGPKLLLPPQLALNLALILHEMATNALQHGAFAREEGTVSVNWSIATEPDAAARVLRMEWLERGGPAIRSPRQSGFGTTLFERGLKLGLGGSFDLDWREEGLVARLTLPLPEAAFRKRPFVT